MLRMLPTHPHAGSAHAGSLLSGWGGAAVPGREVRSEDLATVARNRPLTRGLGRSYGDASLPPPGHTEVAGSALADRILAFDPASGRLTAEAGLTLAEILRLFLPRLFWVPSSPGTKFVTLGGMVASDVHGKSHHRDGTFGRHVEALTVLLGDGRIVRCCRDEHPDLFRATLGGMGLTGHILTVTCRLQRIPSPWILEESERIPDLDRFLEALPRAAADWPYTVGWIDGLSRGGRSGIDRFGRGILMRGRWAEVGEAPADPPGLPRRLTVPFFFPGWALNRGTVAAFNELYYRRHPRRPRRRIVSPDSFFYPLDAIHHWNRIYGRRGFTQYQCVLPERERPGATGRFLDELARSGAASFLTVIKDCGPEGEGLLSFPRPGISIAADLPVRPGIRDLVDRLNERVLAEGGRIYLSKDTFTRREHFQAMEPRLPEFQRIRHRWDPEGRLGSALATRLLEDG